MKESIEIDRSEVRILLDDISVKLFLLEGERKSSKRSGIIDSMLEDENGEMKKLKKLLGIRGK